MPTGRHPSYVVAGALVGLASVLGVVAAVAIVAIYLLAGPGGAGLWGAVVVLYALIVASPILLALLLFVVIVGARRAAQRPPGLGSLGAAGGEGLAWVAMVVGWGGRSDGLFIAGVIGVFLFPLIGWLTARWIFRARYEQWLTGRPGG